MSAAPRRLRQPAGDAATKAYAKLNERLSTSLRDTPPPCATPETNQQCDELYSWSCAVFKEACEASFKRPRNGAQINGGLKAPTSAKLQRLERESKQLGRAMRAAKEERLEELFAREPKVRAVLASLYTFSSFGTDFDHLDAIEKIHSMRKDNKRSIRKEERALQSGVSRTSEQREWDKAMAGGRTKSLFNPPTITNPPWLLRRDSSGQPPILEHDPEAKLGVWSSHFKALMQHTPPPTMPKPWLTTSRPWTTGSPEKGGEGFEWPKLMSVTDLQRLLSRGNRRPSPGPDGMEKWALLNAADDFQEIIVALLNHVIGESYFPEDMKDAFVTPVFKRGDVSDPSNYRGICHSNLLYNIVSTWFNSCFRDYLWAKGLLSPTQVAGQAGVQAGDMISLLQQVDACASVNVETIFVLKRDHRQGFDRVDATAFEDALTYFGFDDNVIRFEQACIGNCCQESGRRRRRSVHDVRKHEAG